ncbi:unnamed protein product [Rotaria sp. Silwood2]|nr:unnamed protein product [Rotaria sp. Silwood2]
MSLLCNSIIKDKQVLTKNGLEMLLLPEHKLLYEKLKGKYLTRNLHTTIMSNDINDSNNSNNRLLYVDIITDQSPNCQIHQNASVSIDHNVLEFRNFSNHLCTQSYVNNNINQLSNTSLCNSSNISSLISIALLHAILNKY